MFRAFGSRSSRVESLKKEAKQWLKALRAGDSTALARLKSVLPEHRASLTLRTVQHALAREHGFAGWQALVDSLGAREHELRNVADEMLRHPIFKGDHRIAVRLFEQHPEVAKLDIYTAAAAGRLDEVERQLAADPAAASRRGGPLDWEPLLYLTYMRLPGSDLQAVETARALLDCGADPNASWNDGWDNSFTALCGVIGLGEGIKPTHARADELAELLLERGAAPFDRQAFYNTSIVHDDTHWLEVLWSHSERRGVTDQWRAVSEKKRIGGPHPASALDFMLSLAVSYNHARRAQWLLAHGADADSRNAYSGRLQREEALEHGNEAIADLLVRHGAAAAPLDDTTAFRLACLRLDRGTAQRLVERHPELLRDPRVLLIAARRGLLGAVQLLADLGMDLDLEDRSGMRALHQAASAGAIDVIEFLIARGAAVDRPTRHYGGALGFAAHFEQRAAAAVLAPHSRDVHNLTSLGMTDRLRELFAAQPELANLVHFRSGLTPLFVLPATEPEALAVARFLLEHGADPTFRSRAGETPADAARKRGLTAAAELLRGTR